MFFRDEATLADCTCITYNLFSVATSQNSGAPRTLQWYVNMLTANTHRDGNAAAGGKPSASIEATLNHHCGTMGVHGSHGIVSQGDVLGHRPDGHLRLHGHVDLSTHIRGGHLRYLAGYLRGKHISGLVDLWKHT